MKVIKKEERFFVSLPGGTKEVSFSKKPVLPGTMMGPFSMSPKPIRAWSDTYFSGHACFHACIVVYDVGEEKTISVRYERSSEYGWDYGTHWTCDPRVRSEVFLDPTDPKNTSPLEAGASEKVYLEKVFGKWFKKTTPKTKSFFTDRDFVSVGEKGNVRLDQVNGMRIIHSVKNGAAKKVLFFLKGGIKSECEYSSCKYWLETLKR